MAKTPTNATKTTAPKVGAAPAKKPTAAPATAEQIADAEAAAAAAANLSEQESQQQTGTQQTGDEPIDVEAIKLAAYNEGYTNGFSAALDEIQPAPGTDEETGEGVQVDTGWADGQTINAADDRARLITLALYTPENQRKGGLFVVVDRLQKYIDGIDPEDRFYALSFMSAIAQTNPMDLASGKFKTLVNEALASVSGERRAIAAANEASEDPAAAEARLRANMPELDDRPSELDAEEAAALPEGVDIDDPDSSAAAAARAGF